MLHVEHHARATTDSHHQTVPAQLDVFDISKIKGHDLAASQDEPTRGDGKLSAETSPGGLTLLGLPAVKDRRLTNRQQPLVGLKELGQGLAGL